MASRLAWLDYSEEHRRHMQEVIDLFREPDTLDELGIGAIRDTFSELLFPGTSTVQTRARYFLFVPWVYREVERRRIPSRRAGEEARRLQTELIYAMERGGAMGSQGIIGWDARESLKRLPSAVYWSGLSAFGIRRFHGSIEDYHRSLDSFYDRSRHSTRGEGDEIHDRLHLNWHPSLPEPPDDLFAETAIGLRPEDAEFLRDQILITQSASFLAHILRNPPVGSTPDTPWDSPLASTAPERLRTQIDHSRRFSAVMHGAALVYNLMLAQLAVSRQMGTQYEELAEDYAEQIADWASQVAGSESPTRGWDLSEFWRVVEEANPRLRLPSKSFAAGWIAIATSTPEAALSLEPRVQAFIRHRETQLKGSQARLTSHRALEKWNGQSGTRALVYRWPTASQVITDIQEALEDA